MKILYATHHRGVDLFFDKNEPIDNMFSGNLNKKYFKRSNYASVLGMSF